MIAAVADRILIVDDEPGIRQAFDLVLGLDYDLSMAASVEEALAISGAEDIQVIFLDGILGGGLSGENALPLFRTRFPRASIVFIGALGEENAKHLMAEGVSIVLPKPWRVEDLISAARRGFRSDPL